MSDDMPEEIYVRKVTKKTLSAIRPESPILLGCLDGKLMRTKYIRADKVIPEGYALVPIEPTEKQDVNAELLEALKNEVKYLNRVAKLLEAFYQKKLQSRYE